MNAQELKQRGVVVDEIDENTLGSYSWYLSPQNEVVCHLYKSSGQTTLYLSRVIMSAPSNLLVDHINGNKLDNRRENLRICTKQQNSCNRKIQSNNKSGYRGVFWDCGTQKWRSQIVVNRKPIHLGCFNDIKKAALAYNEAAVKWQGDYARLNEIQP